MSKEIAVLIILIMVMVITSAVLIYGVYYNWQVSMEYQRDIGKYYLYSDRSSDAVTKSMYFDQYMEAVKKYNLTDGCNAIFFCEQPRASVADQYKVASSLQNRLHEISLLDEKETAYQLGMTQMTENEFEWFNESVFYQKYALSKGAWGSAIIP